MGNDREGILGFTDSFRIGARTRADAAEIEADRRRAELLERPRQRVDNFVVERAGIQRMRMADHAEAGDCLRVDVGRLGYLDQGLKITDRPGNHAALRARGPGRHRTARRTSRRLRRCT